MKIENLRTENDGNKVRSMATVLWEDCDRPAKDIYIEVDKAFSQDFSCNPHSFLVAGLVPAMHSGEKRIFIDEEICPELFAGLHIVMRIFQQWYKRYGAEYRPMQIEAKTLRHGYSQVMSERAGFLISGGIDSLATLRINRLNYPLDHPRSFKDAFLVHGLQPEVDDIFADLVNSLSAITEETNVTLIPLSTNIRYLYDNWPFWADEFEAAVFSAVAHAFNSRIGSMTIASSFDISNLHPHGSHPLLDPNYSSHDMRIWHDDVSISRFAKTKFVAEWDTALQRLRVCNFPNPEGVEVLNCGQCEKCVRTMLALTALDKLKETQVFPVNEVSAELVQTAVQLNKTTYPFYSELIAPLNEAGRHDLARAVEHKISAYRGMGALGKKLKRKVSRFLNV